MKQKTKKTKKEKRPEDDAPNRGKKRLLLLIPLVAVLAGVAIFFVVRRYNNKAAADAHASPPVESEVVSPTPEPTPEDTLTVAETGDFIRTQSPQTLGLAGTNMSQYQVFPSENTVLVDGFACTEVDVYDTNAEAGTNAIAGVFLVTRSGRRHVYRLDPDTKQATELTIPGLQTPAPSPEASPAESGDTT